MHVTSPTKTPPRGWVLYDGTCHLCQSGAHRFHQPLHRRGFALATLQSDFGKKFVTPDTDEMKVITSAGQVLGGAQAIAYLAQFFWYAKPIAWLWKLHFPRTWMEHRYRQIAKTRHCHHGTCQTHPVGGRQPKEARNDFDRWF